MASRRLIGHSTARSCTIRWTGLSQCVVLAPIPCASSWRRCSRMNGITFSADGGASSLYDRRHRLLSRTAARLGASARWGVGIRGDYMGALPDPGSPGDRAPYYTVTYTGGYVTPKQVKTTRS